jgi:antitoxin CptB
VNSALPDPGRLRWRCRRGMRELDQLLVRYLDRRWSSADDAERRVFLRLLDCEDDKLWLWCMGRERPDEQEMHALIEILRELPP